MNFTDPLPVTCPSCGHPQTLPIQTLLRLQARCECGQPLDAVGRDLRAHADRDEAVLLLFRVAAAAEDALGICTPELEFDDTCGLRDILNALRGQARGGDVKAAIEQAVRSFEPAAPRRLEWDAPILDALRPHRWD